MISKQVVLSIILSSSLFTVHSQVVKVLGSSFGIKEEQVTFDEVKGSEFFFDEPANGDIVLSDDQVLYNQLFNITLLDDELLLESNNKVFSIILSEVDEIILKGGDRYLIKEVESGSHTLLEPVVEGAMVSMYRGYYLKEKEPTYNISHDVGVSNKIMTIKDHYYLFRHGQDGLLEIPDQKKKRVEFFGQHFGVDAKKAIVENDLSLRRDDDVVVLVKSLNK